METFIRKYGDAPEEEWLRFLAGERNDDGLRPPPMPDSGFQMMWVGAAGYDTLVIAARFLNAARSRIPQLTPSDRVLDFGCGWGRLTRILLRERFEIVGLDSEPGVIDLCREAMPYVAFELIPNQPPYRAIAEATFDFGYAFSVFSHLSERVALDVFNELARIMKPGSYFALTILTEDHLAIWDGYRDTGNEIQKQAVQSINYDYGDALRRSREGDFLFLPTGGGTETQPSDIYGWAYISRPCLDRMVSNLPFEVADYFSVPELDQNVAIIKHV